MASIDATEDVILITETRMRGAGIVQQRSEFDNVRNLRLNIWKTEKRLSELSVCLLQQLAVSMRAHDMSQCEWRSTEQRVRRGRNASHITLVNPL